MGAGCSSYAGKTAEPLQAADCPPRPPYLACDLVGPPVFEKICIGPIDVLLEQAAQLAEAVCCLNNSLNGVLLDVRLATGLLQGGFSLKISPSPNVDIFTFELLTASGRPLEVAEAARLRGQDITRGGKLSALDAQLVQCLEELADSFAQKVGITTASLTLSASGTLVPKNPSQPMEPVVDAFNRTMLDMRTALGTEYILALHLHKAQAHGAPAFRVQLLKPAPEPQAGTASTAAVKASPVGPGGPLPGFAPATLLDQAACLNASCLADACHAFQDANTHLAAMLKHAGLTNPLTVVPVSSRSVCLAGSEAAASSLNSASTAAATIASMRRHHQPSSSSAAAANPNAARAAAAAVRALPATSRLLVARAVEGFNRAVHSLAHAAAAAPGPGSFAALLTHVLGELRDVVGSAGGEQALEDYRPAVHFKGGPDQAPSVEFRLDTHLEEPRPQRASEGGSEWTQPAPPFPDCLSPPVRRAWLLLQELLRVHNSAVEQLESLRQLAMAFEDGLRRRSNTISQDAAVARLSLAESSEAGRTLLRNRVELRDCCQGALQALTFTAILVRNEMAEAAQLARVQCSFMSPTAWSISIASTATAMTSTSSAATGSSLSFTRGLFTSTSTAARISGGGLNSSANPPVAVSSTSNNTPTNSDQAAVAVTENSGGCIGGSTSSPARWPGIRIGGTGDSGINPSICRRGGSTAAKDMAGRATAAAPAITVTDPAAEPVVACLYVQEDQEQTEIPLPSPSRIRPGGAHTGGTIANGGGQWPSRFVSRVTSQTATGRSAGTFAGSRSIHCSNTTMSAARGSKVTVSGAGWVPDSQMPDSGSGDGHAAAAAAAAAVGPGSQNQSPTRPQRAGLSLASTASAAEYFQGGRVGVESLADEYARAALAHLRLQEL